MTSICTRIFLTALAIANMQFLSTKRCEVQTDFGVDPKARFPSASGRLHRGTGFLWGNEGASLSRCRDHPRRHGPRPPMRARDVHE